MTKYNKNEIERIVKKYDIKLLGEDKITVFPHSKTEKEFLSNFMQENKPQILEYLKDKKKEVKEWVLHKEKWEEENGVKEIYDCLAAWQSYYKLIEEYNNSESGVYPSEPTCSKEQLAKKYPAGFDYVEIERCLESTNMHKVAIYQDARDRILTGEDHKKVMEDANAAWTAYCMEHQVD